MNGDSRFDQIIPSLRLRQFGLAHFHARKLGAIQDRVGAANRGIEPREALVHFRGRVESRLAGGVALHADRAFCSSDESVAGMLNSMIAVACDASGHAE